MLSVTWVRSRVAPGAEPNEPTVLAARMGHSALTFAFGRNRVATGIWQDQPYGFPNGTVTMVEMKQIWRALLFAAVVAMAALAFGQDAQETPAPPTGQPSAGPTNPGADDPDLAAEVQRLRTDLDRLQRQVSYLTNLIEQMESERTPVQSVPAKPAAKSNSKKKPATVADAAGPSAPSIAPDVDDRVIKTLLVFKDGHKVEATNYAIVGQSLWIYTEEDSKRVPLTDLDVTATKNANSDRGVTFQVPPTK